MQIILQQRLHPLKTEVEATKSEGDVTQWVLQLRVVAQFGPRDLGLIEGNFCQLDIQYWKTAGVPSFFDVKMEKL